MARVVKDNRTVGAEGMIVWKVRGVVAHRSVAGDGGLTDLTVCSGKVYEQSAAGAEYAEKDFLPTSSIFQIIRFGQKFSAALRPLCALCVGAVRVRHRQCRSTLLKTMRRGQSFGQDGGVSATVSPLRALTLSKGPDDLPRADVSKGKAPVARTIN